MTHSGAIRGAFCLSGGEWRTAGTADFDPESGETIEKRGERRLSYADFVVDCRHWPGDERW